MHFCGDNGDAVELYRCFVLFCVDTQKVPCKVGLVPEHAGVVVLEVTAGHKPRFRRKAPGVQRMSGSLKMPHVVAILICWRSANCGIPTQRSALQRRVAFSRIHESGQK